ncbi:MAG: class I SAM-dependent methyltransferase [Rhodanobacteraceae bacterium]
MIDLADTYVSGMPNSQNVLDIFKDEWSSRLPDEFGLTTTPGTARLFEDGRVEWAREMFGEFSDWSVLELGPLEGGHSYMLQRAGAGKVISVEANRRAFLKCLCMKEVLDLGKVRFLLGDFIPFLEQSKTRYDLTFASGVLYHMEEPWRLLQGIANVSDRMFLWTHYYDEAIIRGNPALAGKFSDTELMEFGGCSYECSIQSYQDALEWSGFCGGPKRVSRWLTRASLMDAIKRFGFNNIEVNFDHSNHPNGPALAVCASK